ncbi:MAG: beta-galactosidase [Verrucomicrobia bacterium]|nr:beta-galactosidase [Verrucomicrobiota bacterium]
MERYDPVIPGFAHMLHGGDYNPEQWLDRPDVLDEDFRLAKLAGVNTWTIGIFSWTALEPEEGRFEFGWMDHIMDRMAENGMKAVLATPSGGKPNWMAAKYPEIRRVSRIGDREPQGGRENHCFTSPVFREKVTLINTRLAERYRKHSALGLWHLSNEYNGECHCALCKQAFREWLKRKYGTLASLNHAWWTAFWSHTHTDWQEIDAIDNVVHGMGLDWRRFVSDQTTDFIRCEAAPLRKLTPGVPVTTNFMGTYPDLDYRRLAAELDVVSWDSYPIYHGREDTVSIATYVSYVHDINRGMKGGRPFLMMESSPSAVNWMPVNKLLRPGVHRLKSLQAVAHGSDSVQYFQWRKGRGGMEKFHGAVVDHVGNENTRVFGDVAELGQHLGQLADVVGTSVPAEVAILYDWENVWALNAAAGPLKKWGCNQLREDWEVRHYHAFWKQGIPVDVVASTDDLSRYKLVVAPMIYLLLPGVAENLTAFVNDGGTLVGTFLTGIADENDLVIQGGWPGPLRPLFGIWSEEIDYLYEDEENHMKVAAGTVGLKADYRVTSVCDLIHAESAHVLATYGSDFYEGRPALTVNRFGKGQAYYMATYTDQPFLDDFYKETARRLGINRALPGALPEGVTAQIRSDGKTEFVFVMNFTTQTVTIEIGRGHRDLISGSAVGSKLELPGYGVSVLARESKIEN